MDNLPKKNKPKVTLGLRVEEELRSEFQNLKDLLKNDVDVPEAARIKFRELLKELRAKASQKAS